MMLPIIFAIIILSGKTMIYCTGEAVYDIIFRDDKPVDGKAGGAMLNAAVSLGRTGLPVAFVGDFADDRIGHLTCDFLKSNHVDVSFVTFYQNARSRIALAFLNDRKDADYIFYKIRVDKPELRFPLPVAGDIILFGSWLAIKPEVHAEVRDYITCARHNGALIIYDPNFRRAHLHTLPQVKSHIEENIGLAHITKGSDEDFQFILGQKDRQLARDYVKSLGCENFIYTANRDGAWLIRGEEEKHYAAMDIEPVSTVGAGDSFNAGLVFALERAGCGPDNLQSLPPAQWDDAIRTSIRFASEVCMSYDNYISKDFAGAL